MAPKADKARALADHLVMATHEDWAVEALVHNELADELPKLEDIAASAPTSRGVSL